LGDETIRFDSEAKFLVDFANHCVDRCFAPDSTVAREYIVEQALTDPLDEGESAIR
jgi:hypothetical protein